VKIELQYQIFKTKIPAIRHKQHYEFHSKFRPWDGRQMVDTQFLLYILVKICTKSYHETNIYKFYPIGFTRI
jgi:hypothetical protein